ncbi:hypothetical protein CSUI_007044 [Cystoisospora suis]|uniref:Uncharacterized protein n=1 Tax=Cystoisospora suis TaxID=483139 RepID=A0A2C6KNK9_9APIC|nr:hypothetical protein CSUI_007044 [Cystoisospora suis]
MHLESSISTDCYLSFFCFILLFLLSHFVKGRQHIGRQMELIGRRTLCLRALWLTPDVFQSSYVLGVRRVNALGVGVVSSLQLVFNRDVRERGSR